MLTNDEKRSQHVIQKSIWMSDYKIFEIDQFDKPFTHFVLFLDCDSMTFKDIIKEPKWQKAINVEIDAINRNNIWELITILRR